MNPGDRISRYRIERPLGQGGMGVVYLAEDTRLHRPVALKFLPSDALTEQDKLRFLHEAQAAALIRHPNICPIHDIEETGGQLFISMAYLEGETLAKHLSRGRLPVEEAVDIAIQIAQGLEKAHSLGIVHRDIKSRNIIVGPDGHVSILDFGLALLPGAERLTVAGHTVGTPMYMSPEQCEGRVVDARTDIWSLGVVLFEMLTGTLPFRREQAAAVAYAILHDPAPPIAPMRPEAPLALQRVVEKAMAKKPAGRWGSAGEMAAALRSFGRDTRAPVSGYDTLQPATLTMPAVPAATEGKSRRRRTIGIAAGVALAAALGTYVYQLAGPASRGEGSTASPVAASTPEKLIAVLPFEILGSAADTADIANGVTEILTAGLADFERFEGGIATIPGSEIRRRNINTAAEAKRVYGANLVVAGTAQPRGGKIQFTIELIDPARTRQLAARVFEYDPANPVAARQRAIDELAGLLSMNGPVARRAATGGETTTPAASLAYLKGRGLLARYDVAGNLDQAIAQLGRAVELDPNYALAHAALGEACWRKSRAAGDVKLAARAIEHGERAVRLEPGLPTAHTSLAAIYTTSGREEDAIRELKEALKLAPGSAEAARELARVYVAMGRFGEAEAAYREAIAARPTDWYGHLLLGLLYSQQFERYDDAAASFARARELTPDNELIYRNLGVVYLKQGRYQQAVAELQRSLRLKSNATTYSSLGTAYFRQRRYAEAIAAVETAIDLDPKRHYFWGNLGIYCKWNPGSEGQARTAFAKAIELAGKFLEVSPKDYDVRADLAEYQARLGNKAAALAEIGKLPESARLARISRIAIVYEFTGNRAKAIPLLAATVKNPATWHQIEDDPDLAALWSDPALQKLLGRRR